MSLKKQSCSKHHEFEAVQKCATCKNLCCLECVDKVPLFLQDPRCVACGVRSEFEKQHMEKIHNQARLDMMYMFFLMIPSVSFAGTLLALFILWYTNFQSKGEWILYLILLICLFAVYSLYDPQRVKKTLKRCGIKVTL